VGVHLGGCHEDLQQCSHLHWGGASLCQLGASGTAQAIIPPSLCTLYLADSSSTTCSVFIKGCVPRTPQAVAKDSTDQIIGLVSSDVSGDISVLIAAGTAVGSGRLLSNGQIGPAQIDSLLYYASNNCVGSPLVDTSDGAGGVSLPTLVAGTLYAPAGPGVSQAYQSYSDGVTCTPIPSGIPPALLAPAVAVTTFTPPFHVEVE
jgi:hypothetical protein